MADEPIRWLTPAEARTWRAWVDVVGRVSTGVETDLRSASDLGTDDYEVLVRLSEAPEHRLRLRDLAAQVVNSPSRLSQRIDRLSRRGFVTREQCPTDRRGLLAVLTDEGFQYLEQAAPDHVESVRTHLIDRLSEADIESLGDILSRLADTETNTEEP